MESCTSSNQETLDRVYHHYQCNIFMINNVLVYHILSKLFMDMGEDIYAKQRISTQDGHLVFFDIHQHFLGPNHVTRQATDAENRCKPFTMMMRGKVGIGQVCHTSQGTACHHGEPYRLWLWWNGQWYQSLPLSPRHQEH